MTHETPPSPVRFSDTALDRIQSILSEEPSGAALRMFVQGGGCSGFQYGFTLDPDRQDDDWVVTLRDAHEDRPAVVVLLDAFSLPYLQGSEIDFIDDVQGAQFVVKNPNATTTCGCGASFAPA